MILYPITGTSLKLTVMQKSLYFHFSTVSPMSPNTIDLQVFLNPAFAYHAYHMSTPSEEHQVSPIQPLHIPLPLLLHPYQNDRSLTIY